MTENPIPAEVLGDFRNHLYHCFKYLGLGTPTAKQYAMAHAIETGPLNVTYMGGRRDGKSVIMACYGTFLLAKDPNTTVLVISAGADRAIKFISQMRAILDVVPYMEHLKPDVNTKDSAFGFNVGCRTKHNQDLSVTARGITSQITGLHADHIIGDDIEIPENSETPAARAKLQQSALECINVSNQTETSTIRLLGTPQSAESVYMSLQHLLPIVKFPAEMPDKSLAHEVEGVHEYILGLDLEPGESTQPERFSTEKLREIEAAIGPSNYALHYKLITTVGDMIKFPLRLENLVAMDVPRDEFPLKVIHAKSVPSKRVPLWGLKNDAIYEPMYIEPRFRAYNQTACFIDVSGMGADETGVCIASRAGSYIVIHALLGFNGGYSDETLNKICDFINDYGCTVALPEKNYGGGMFNKVFAPYLIRNCKRCGLGSYESKGQKETRIIDTLEPVMAQHRLVVSFDVLKDKENQIQLTRIQKRRGALKHDDRVDVLAAAVKYYSDAIALDPEVSIKQSEEEQWQEAVADLKNNKRFVALLGSRISGAVLVQGRPISEADRANRNILNSNTRRR